MAVEERVRCLGCGTMYLRIKPRGVGEEECPACGYVGWMPDAATTGAAPGGRSLERGLPAPPRRETPERA